MIEVSVYATSLDYSQRKSALRRRLDNDHFDIPYDSIIRANKCLFGNDCVVEFVVL